MQNKIPKLREHQVQKNYVAIWYSVIIHFVLVIFLVNHNKIQIKEFLYETRDGLIDMIQTYNEPDIMKQKINELFTMRDNTHT